MPMHLAMVGCDVHNYAVFCMRDFIGKLFFSFLAFCWFVEQELATWLVGSAVMVDGDDLAAQCSSNDDAPTILHADCLFNIIVENAQDNLDILLPTLQFVEVCTIISTNFYFLEIMHQNTTENLVLGLIGQCE